MNLVIAFNVWKTILVEFCEERSRVAFARFVMSWLVTIDPVSALEWRKVIKICVPTNPHTLYTRVFPIPEVDVAPHHYPEDQTPECHFWVNCPPPHEVVHLVIPSTFAVDSLVLVGTPFPKLETLIISDLDDDAVMAHLPHFPDPVPHHFHPQFPRLCTLLIMSGSNIHCPGLFPYFHRIVSTIDVIVVVGTTTPDCCQLTVQSTSVHLQLTSGEELAPMVQVNTLVCYEMNGATVNALIQFPHVQELYCSMRTFFPDVYAVYDVGNITKVTLFDEELFFIPPWRLGSYRYRFMHFEEVNWLGMLTGLKEIWTQTAYPLINCPTNIPIHIHPRCKRSFDIQPHVYPNVRELLVGSSYVSSWFCCAKQVGVQHLDGSYRYERGDDWGWLSQLPDLEQVVVCTPIPLIAFPSNRGYSVVRHPRMKPLVWTEWMGRDLLLVPWVSYAAEMVAVGGEKYNPSCFPYVWKISQTNGA